MFTVAKAILELQELNVIRSALIVIIVPGTAAVKLAHKSEG